MKGNRLKTLGFALLGGLGLLFAGCTQQAPSQGSTTVAIEGLYDGDTRTPVDLNNVRGLVIVRAKVALGSVVPEKVQFLLDDNVEYEVNFGTATQGVRPQQAAYTFEWNLNTAALTGTTPKYLNGPHTVAVRLVRGGNPVATSTATNVRFNNADRVILALQGNSAQDANNYTWYGGADLTLVATPVLYSGSTAAKVRVTAVKSDILSASIGAAGVDASFGSGSTAENPVSGGTATFTLPKAANGSVEGGMRFDARIRYQNGTLSPSSIAFFALDFKAPTFTDFRVNLNGVYSDTIANILSSTNDWLNGQSPITFAASDQGVGGVTYQIQVLQGNTVKATLNPGDTLSGVPEAPTGTYTLQVVNLRDALGNTPTPGPSPSPSFGLDKTKPTLSTTFGAEGKALNGTLAATLRSIPLRAQDGSVAANSSGVPGANNGALPSASGPGTAGWIPTVATGGCTYTLSAPVFSAVGASQTSFSLDMVGSGGASPQPSCTYPNITTSSGDGSYTVTLRLVDRARNVSDPVTVSFYWMTQRPVVQFLQSPSGTYSLGGSNFVQVNGAVKVTHPSGRPIHRAIFYAQGATGQASDVQLVATPNVNLFNNSALTFNQDGTVSSGNFYDFTANAANFPFTLQFNATGSYSVVAAAVPEAYDNQGNVNVTNLGNSTSASVNVN